MKKLLSLILAAMMLVSCTPAPAPDETIEEPGFEFTTIPHYLSTTLTQSAELAEYRDEGECGMTTTAPIVQFVGDKVYLFRRFPEDLIGFEPILDFEAGITSGNYENLVEIYDRGSYDEPSEVITLTGHADGMLRLDCFEYLPDSDTFVTVQKYYHIDDPDVFTVRIFDGEGRMISEKDIVPPSADLDEWGPNTFFLMGGDLYYDQDMLSIYRYDIDTDTEHLINGGINGFTPSDGKIIYIRHKKNDEFEMEYQVCEYDPAQDKSFLLGKFCCNLEDQNIRKDTWINLAYDRPNRMLYYAPSTAGENAPFGIRAAKIDGDSYVQVLALTEFEQYTDEMTCTGDQLVVRIGNNQLLLYDIPDTPIAIGNASVPLRFCICNPEIDSADNYESDIFRLLEMNGIMARSEGTYINGDPDEYAFTMAKKLLAGDTDFDIFVVTTEMAELFKEGYYADLALSSSIMKQMDKTLPGVKELCTIGDTLSLVPTSLELGMLVVSDSRIQSGYKVPSVFADLADLASTVVPAGEKDRFISEFRIVNFILPWFEQFIANFMADRVDDETAQADLLALYETGVRLMRHENVVLDNSYQSYKPVIDPRTSMSHVGRVSADESMLPILPLTENYAQAVSGMFYAINPNSPNRELAELFLAGVMYRQSETNSRWYTDSVDENEYDEGEKPTLPLYRELIGSSVRYYNADIRMRLFDDFNGIDAETRTAEDAAEELFRYLKMMKYE
ncbi:MAG: hypothetical protein IJ037_09205 [Clostridia bacterium]|nr:hypothetical protein [Clostridia bacterium]